MSLSTVHNDSSACWSRVPFRRLGGSLQARCAAQKGLTSLSYGCDNPAAQHPADLAAACQAGAAALAANGDSLAAVCAAIRVLEVRAQCWAHSWRRKQLLDTCYTKHSCAWHRSAPTTPSPVAAATSHQAPLLDATACRIAPIAMRAGAPTCRFRAMWSATPA
jgi:hypothetical protein